MKERYWFALLAIAVMVFLAANTYLALPTSEVCIFSIPIVLILVIGYIDTMND